MIENTCMAANSGANGDGGLTATIDRIFVCCPAGAVTGGPELLHQLVDALRKLGHDAFISYYPFDKPALCPQAYRHYDTAQAPVEDAANSLVIVPELGVYLLRKLRRAQGAIWWLSVDNYAGATGSSLMRDWFNLTRRFASGKWQPRAALKGYRHFVQSHYAALFLAEAGIASSHLSDYLGAAHIVDKSHNPLQRRDLIAYNPRKGMAVTRALIAGNPQFQFQPIENMSAGQVSALLATARIYIDFGNHPGKDRMPREAAMAGCCIITGRRGSAKFDEDIAIDASYKLDERAAGFRSAFTALVGDIFSDFSRHQRRFRIYRDVIRQEPARFQLETRALFGNRLAAPAALPDDLPCDETSSSPSPVEALKGLVPAWDRRQPNKQMFR